MATDALSRRPAIFEARLEAMEINDEEQLEDVLDRQLVAVMAKLKINLSIIDRIRVGPRE